MVAGIYIYIYLQGDPGEIYLALNICYIYLCHWDEHSFPFIVQGIDASKDKILTVSPIEKS